MHLKLLMFFSFYSLLPILPLYIFEKLNAGSTVSGIILASYTIGALLCRPFAGISSIAFPESTYTYLPISFFHFYFLVI